MNTYIQSPLNYTGGKHKLLPQILPYFPRNIDVFVDLFCGGANVGCNVECNHVVFNDIDSRIIHLLEVFKYADKQDVFDLISYVIDKYELSWVCRNGYGFYGCESGRGVGGYNKAKFLQLREEFNQMKPPFDIQYYVMLYVLIVFSFNNQIRFNSKGEFNLPVGKRDFNGKLQKKLHVFIDRMQSISCSFKHDDFRRLDLASLSENDFVYCDPPYLITCATYNEQGLWKDDLLIRQNRRTIDDVIVSALLEKENYRQALSFLLESPVTDENICAAGINRKSRKYDMPYATLFGRLYTVFFENDLNGVSDLLKAIDDIKTGRWWRAFLFDTSNRRAILNNPRRHIKTNVFQNATTEDEFKKSFFEVMHLFKAKATLSDYYDLNRRYIKTTGIVLFEDGHIKLDIVPKQFFNQAIARGLYTEAFSGCASLPDDVSLTDISAALVFDERKILEDLNADLDESLATIDEAYSAVERKKYERFNKLIDSKFSDETLLELLGEFDRREDESVNSIVTDNADIPTIFEYVLGVIWYKISNRKGKILDYMKLSLDADLLPITHAAGGEADLVYEYDETDNYPGHCLLLEATLADKTNQRRMEMEPVSRHLGNHLLATHNLNSYCVFVTNNLNINVVSDFRGRKNMIYCNPQNPESDYIQGMKIIPLDTSDLRSIIQGGKKYPELYKRFEEAFLAADSHPKTWYDRYVTIRQEI